MAKHLHTILIVDDEEIIRDSFEDIFTSRGYRVVTAENGIKALDIVNSNVIDLAIVDIKMPKMSGLELLGKLKENYSDLPVIIMTGYGSEDTAMHALQLGASNYLKKPFNILKVVDTIEKVLFYKVTKDRIQKKDLLIKKTLENLNLFELSFPIDIETIEGGVIFVSEYLFSGSPFKTNVEIGVHEALLNAYYHGSLNIKKYIDTDKGETNFYSAALKRAKAAEVQEKSILLRIESTEKSYSFIIEDQGEGFDWKDVSNSVETDLEQKPFGRGITLIKSFFDEVKWNEKGNKITITMMKSPEKT